MGWAKYMEDNDALNIDRWRIKSDRADYEYTNWTADVTRANEIIKVQKSEKRDSNKKRLKELYEIKENLQFKMNLVLSIANSLENHNVKFVTMSLNNGVEDSYIHINKIIRLLEENETYFNNATVDRKQIKRNMIKNIFFKMEMVINQVEEISQNDMEAIKKDLARLIAWYYKKDCNLGRILGNEIDGKMIIQFVEKELDGRFCSCPVCGKKTVENLRFCIECAREW